jgi:hypothetical protein
MAYALAVVLLLAVAAGVALARGQRRRARELRALKAVMRQVMGGDPEAPRSED